MTFGEKLQELREAKGITQEAFAREAGVTIGTIRNQEQGRRGISTESLYSYCKLLSASCTAFEGCTTKKASSPKKKPKGGTA